MYNYIRNNRERLLSELFELLKTPSISTNIAHKQDMDAAAEYLAKKLTNADVDSAELYSTKGHPIVYAEKILDDTLPTVLIYGHYDVQPPDPIDLWETPPFSPEIRKTKTHPEGAIFARGACDDKGQMYCTLLPLNIWLR